MNQQLTKVLKVYLIIPIAVAIFLMDRFLQLGYLQALPSVPEKFLLFNFFFNLPHIVASNILLADREVYSRYSQKIGIFLVLSIIVTSIFHYYLNWTLFIYVHSLWTLKHVIMQQFNLSYSSGLERSLKVDIWKWTGLLLGLICYWDIYEFFDFRRIYQSYSSVPIVTSCVFGLFSIYLLYQYWKKPSFIFVFANTSLIFVSYFLYNLGAGFISVLLIRVVHDCTSFIFYEAVTDGKKKSGKLNWLQSKMSNTLGSVLSTTLPPIIIVVILFSLPFKKEVISLLMVLSLMHYFTEGFTWKSDGPYRRYL